MPSHEERRVLPHSPRFLYDLVADIESYPQFLPWCRSARIHERKQNSLSAELQIGFRGMTESFTSRVTLDPEGWVIATRQIAGPFSHMQSRWRFLPVPESPPEDAKPLAGQTEICFDIDYAFRSPLLRWMLGIFFDEAVSRLIASFSHEAEKRSMLVSEPL